MTILILGGTAEARLLAERLVGAGKSVISSLAGRVSNPALPAGEVRIGGFGGVGGLADYLRDQQIEAVVDATHPFAARISAHAVAATDQARTPLLRLARPGWRDHPHAAEWRWFDSIPQAVAAAPAGERPLLTTGRQDLDAFLPWARRWVHARVVDPPQIKLPDRWVVLRSRGPYDYDHERELMQRYEIDMLVSKESGGSYTSGKLAAAASLGIPVIMIARPAVISDVPSVADVDQAVAWLESLG